MFTIKFYSGGGYRQRILEAESFTILRDEGDGAEITLHQKNGAEDRRIDIGPDQQPASNGVPIYQSAIIENAAGKTTEMIGFAPSRQLPPRSSPTVSNAA